MSELAHPAHPGHPASHDQIVVPRPVVYMILALMLFALVSVSLGRWLQVGVTHEGVLVPVREVTFRYSQSFRGPVDITFPDGRRLTLVEANAEAVPRLILRSVATFRAREGVDQAAPLKLIETRDGERLLIDDAAHRTLRLAAFGANDNQHTFDRLFAETGR